MIGRVRALPDYLAGVPVVRRVYVLMICLAIGGGMASFAWIAKQDHDHGREERRHNIQINRRQDITDRALRQAIARLERLEIPTRADVERLVRRLGRRGSRRVLEQLLSNASPGQLRRLERATRERATRPPQSAPAPQRRRRRPSASPPPGGSTPPSGRGPVEPGTPPTPSPPSAPMILDLPPVDPDGPGGRGPLYDPSPIEVPPLVAPLLPPPRR